MLKWTCNTMKIKSRKSSKKLWVILSVVLLVAIGSAVAYALTRTPVTKPAPTSQPDTSTPSKSVNVTEPSNEQITSGQDNKKQSLDTTQNSTTTTTTPDTLAVTITAANKNGNTLQIRSLIDAVIGSGTCSLTLSNGSSVVTKSASIQAGPNNSTCTGFDVPVSELSTGTWTIKITVTSEGKTGTAQSQVTI